VKRIPYILLSFSIFSVFATHAENTASAASTQNNAGAKVLSIEEEISLLDKDFLQLENQLQVSINEDKKEVAAVFETDVQALPKDAAYETDEIADDDIALIEELEEDLLADDADDELFEELLTDQLSDSADTKAESAAIYPVSITNEQEAAIAPAIKFESQERSLPKEDPAVIAMNDEKKLQPAIASAATKTVKEAAAVEINLHQVFSGSPAIYSILLVMSVVAVFIWLYSILSLRSSGRIPSDLYKNLHNKLSSNNFHEALDLCSHNNNIFCKMIASGIASRSHGLPAMLEAMKAEGKRASVAFWQRVGLLNDIAIIAPMLGLLGTVLGMFYAFYDINRSIESVSTLFDGLGISVGSTVAGLIVAIVALILQSLAKFRIVKVLSTVENEALSMATLIDDRTSLHKN